MQLIRNERDIPSKGITLFTVLAVSALFGALFGALCCLRTDSGLAEMLANAEEKTLEVRRSGELSRIILSSLAGTGIYLCIAFVLGFSAIAQPLEVILPFFKGIGGGVILTQLYGQDLSRVSLIKGLAVFPGVFLSLVVMIIASREAIYLSGRLFDVCFQKRIADGMLGRIKLYAVRFAALLAATSLCALLDCALAMLLLGRS